MVELVIGMVEKLDAAQVARIKDFSQQAYPSTL
jgi:hypothetical protein